MTAPPLERLEALALAVLPEVDSAQQVMTTAQAVPDEVADLIDRAAELFDNSLPSWGIEGVDPYLGQALLAAILAGEKGLRAPNDDVRRRRVRLALERLRQTLRDIVDEAPTDENADIKSIVQWLARTMSVSQPDLAGLLGVSLRTLQRWLAADGPRPEGEDEARVRMVARTVGHLRHVFTGPGVLKWFERPHPDLDGVAPVALLHDPLELPRLVRMASRARSTMAT